MLDTVFIADTPNLFGILSRIVCIPFGVRKHTPVRFMFGARRWRAYLLGMIRADNIHATCVALGAHGVLLRGPSGSGKSDLALRLIDQYGEAILVSDDRTDITARGGMLYASAVAAIAGRMEVRGVGIIQVPFVAKIPVSLVIDLVPLAQVPRLPAATHVQIAGISVPGLSLSAFEVSTPAKIRQALRMMVSQPVEPVP